MLERTKLPDDVVPPGGRIDASSPHEPDYFVMHQAVFHILLDSSGHVSELEITEF
jgi:hypothetical protein